MNQCFQKTVEKYAQEIKIKIHMKNYQSVYQFVKEYPGYERGCHILCLDMEAINDFDVSLIVTLKNENPRLNMCFVSNRETNVFIPYQLNAIGYVLNPITPKLIKEMLVRNLAYELYCVDSIEKRKRYLTIAKQTSKICEDDIVYIEKCINQIKIVCLDKAPLYYDTLQNLYDQLNNEQFGYTHIGYIANLYYIRDVDKQWVYFLQNKKIPLSRTRQKGLFQWHNDTQTKLIRERYIKQMKAM
jgi:DNA-binding LytR/AlgR family response regulator